MQLFDYQKDLYKGLLSTLKKEGTACLAATTGAGKTEIAATFLRNHKKARVLVLTHNQKVLRDNFYDRLVRIGSFKAGEIIRIESKKDLKRLKKQRIVVALPSNIHRYLKDLPAFDYLLVDEAHEYYRIDTEMYGKIISWHQGKTILLTASHYTLNVPKVVFAREDSLRVGRSENITCSLVLDGTKIKDEDYADNELKKEADVKLSKTTYDIIRDNIDGPTLIACHSINEANKIKRKLRGVKAVVSHSMEDYDSENIAAFTQGKYDVCIVVNRAVLGFDYPDLKTMIDVTYSMNVKRLEQQIGRLCRIGNTSDKTYIKIAPADREAHYKLVMTAVNVLTER